MRSIEGGGNFSKERINFQNGQEKKRGGGCNLYKLRKQIERKTLSFDIFTT